MIGILFPEHPMSEQEQQLRHRDHLMRQEALRLTPEQRMARMLALQDEMFDQLRKNPEAWERFYRRNIRKRAVRHDPDQTL